MQALLCQTVFMDLLSLWQQVSMVSMYSLVHVFLTVCLFRLIDHHFTREHHFGFEAAAWYWHFVDVVWLFLFVVIYWWGGA